MTVTDMPQNTTFRLILGLLSGIAVLVAASAVLAIADSGYALLVLSCSAFTMTLVTLFVVAFSRKDDQATGRINYRSGQTHAPITASDGVVHEPDNRAQLIQAEKLASLGILVAGLAHEINNPNHTIMATSAILDEAWKDLGPLIDGFADENGDFTVAGTGYSDFSQTMPQYLDGLSRASERIRDVVANLRDFAKQDVYDIDEIVDLNLAVRTAVTLMRSHIQKHTMRFSLNCGDGIPTVRGNATRLQQVFVHIIQNACLALRSQTERVDIATDFPGESDFVRVTIRDQGAGIDSENLDRLCDPFFTTRRTSGGTGLGLSVSQSIVEDHGGELHIDSEVGVGTIVSVLLPVARDERIPRST